jgi:tetratricopeptide (TPR) repeat protein
MKKVISVIVIIFSSSLSLSAQVNIDSPRLVWNDTTQPDTVRLQAMDNIIWDGYLFSQPDSAYYYAQLEYNFAKNKGLKKQMAIAINVQGISFWIRDNYRVDIDYYTRSLTIKEEIGDISGIASSLNNLGVIYKAQDNYRVAIDYYTRSLTIKEEIEDKKGIATSLNNIGSVYFKLDDFIAAHDFQTRGLTIMKEIGDKYGMAECLNSIADIYREQDNYNNAIDYHTRSLTIREEIGDKQRIIRS